MAVTAFGDVENGYFTAGCAVALGGPGPVIILAFGTTFSAMNQFSRITHPDGLVELCSAAGSFRFRRLRPGVMLVMISGQDNGQFGQAALDEMRMEILRSQPLELLVDAEQATLVATGVSKEWTQFFSNCRTQLKRVSVLTGSRYMNLVVSISQHLSKTGNLITVTSDRAAFDAAVERARQD
jgi:hypothetical protein